MDYINSLKAFAKKWSKLKSWPTRLVFSSTIRKGSSEWTSGHAYVNKNNYIVVTAGTNQADGYASLLHEIAHIASPGKKHHWRLVEKSLY